MLRTNIFGSRRAGSGGSSIVQRVGRSLLSRTSNPSFDTSIKRISWDQQQKRTFFSSFLGQSMSRMMSMKKITDAIDGTSDERKKVEYIRALVAYAPKTAMQQIERGWENGKLPVNEAVLREYLKSAAALKKLDTLNITGLVTLIQKHNGGILGDTGGSGGGGLSPQALVALLNSGQRFSAGGTPNEPLFVATQEATWKTQAWRFVRNGVSLFLLLSFVGAIMDEKGAGGLSGRMGIGSAVHQAEESDKSFKDVVGVDEAKAELEEIVMYLRDSKRFTRLGGKLPKGILLTGPPGTGKTLLARAIAGEAKVPFFYSSGSEFEEMYVGVGARRVRDLFEAAKAKSPCIIFIDEIDAIGGSRHLKEQSAMKMTLNQLLVEMDGFEQNNGVIVIAATNFADSLDSALTRPGRFDKVVDVPPPDIGGRKAILELYAKKVPLASDVDMEQLARGTPGFTGAELYNLVNQAAVKASKDGLKAIGMSALEYAKDKIMMGAERKSAIISPETMRVTAFHEAGHALVALMTDGCDPIHKATIMPRGRSLGMVMQLPDGDQTSMTRKQMLARLDVCMGGRVAEEIVLGHDNITSGASSDIMQATRLAKAMVTKYGLSEKVGVMFLDDKEKQSGETQGKVDDEVRLLLSDSYGRAKKLLETHRKELDLIAQGLLEYESLSGGEIVDIINGTKPNIKGLRSQRPSRATQPLRSGGSPGAASTGTGASPSPPEKQPQATVTSSFVTAIFGSKPTPATAPPTTSTASAPITTATVASTTSATQSTVTTKPQPPAKVQAPSSSSSSKDTVVNANTITHPSPVPVATPSSPSSSSSPPSSSSSSVFSHLFKSSPTVSSPPPSDTGSPSFNPPPPTSTTPTSPSPNAKGQGLGTDGVDNSKGGLPLSMPLPSPTATTGSTSGSNNSNSGGNSASVGSNRGPPRD